MATDFYNSKESVQEYIRLAKDVSGAKLIEKLKPYLPGGSTLLELGSGPGTDWNILKEIYKVTGSDYSPAFIEHLKSSNPDGEFIQLDGISINTVMLFDCIYSNKVLHLFTDEELIQSFKRQLDVLNSGGIICHSFWKGEGSEEYNGMFVNLHTKKRVNRHFEI